MATQQYIYTKITTTKHPSSSHDENHSTPRGLVWNLTQTSNGQAEGGTIILMLDHRIPQIHIRLLDHQTPDKHIGCDLHTLAR
jgi:hypothetical protein